MTCKIEYDNFWHPEGGLLPKFRFPRELSQGEKKWELSSDAQSPLEIISLAPGEGFNVSQLYPDSRNDVRTHYPKGQKLKIWQDDFGRKSTIIAT